MSNIPLIPVQGIWLRREGDYAVVYVTKADGKSYEAIREYIGPIENTFSHHISGHGLEGLWKRDPIELGVG